MHRFRDLLKAPISKTATMLPTSIAFGDSKKLTKWGPVMIPDITQSTCLSLRLLVCIPGSKSYIPLIISELSNHQKTDNSICYGKTHEKYAQTGKHRDGIQHWLVSNQFPARFYKHGLRLTLRRLPKLKFRAFSLIEKVDGDGDARAQFKMKRCVWTQQVKLINNYNSIYINMYSFLMPRVWGLLESRQANRTCRHDPEDEQERSEKQ